MKLFAGRSRRFKVVTIFISTLCLLLTWVMMPSVWFSSEMQARVVTPGGVPVAGAIVVANWNITGPWNGASLGQLEIAETVTDKDGQFRIPAWGPRFLSKGAISIDQPTVRIFKPGFIPVIIKNYEGVPMGTAKHNMVFRLQNQSIDLIPFKGALSDYELKLHSLRDGLEQIFSAQVAEGCYWKRMPRLLITLERQKMELERKGVQNTLMFAYQYASGQPSMCGDAKQFFLEYVN